MPTTQTAVYIAAFVTFLVTWIPAVLAQRQGQSRRLSYLMVIILYLQSRLTQNSPPAQVKNKALHDIS